MRHASSAVSIRMTGQIRRRAELFMSGAAIALLSTSAMAGPQGERVVRGNVGITRNGNETVIRAGNNSIINYRSFDIARGETVRFIQPSASSRVLNRIESAMPTRIDGSLIANGRVYLINPAGVYFGQGSVINVAGLYTAAAKMTDKNFLGNVNQFTDASGTVSNAGTITADFVGLVGRQVLNSGNVVAPQGTVVFGAGKDVFIGEKQGNIFVRVSGEAGAQAAVADAQAGSAASTGVNAGIQNTGTINTRDGARGGRAIMGTGDVFGTALFSSGAIAAREVKIEGQGRGVVDVRGTIDASNADGRGGSVKILGEKVALNNATIDASGATGGGDVMIGGDFQGHGPDRNAERTFISSDTTIKADATQSGDGGNVVVWSNQITGYNGSISARGGEQGGNGGNVEVSGKQNLMFRGTVDVSRGGGASGRGSDAAQQAWKDGTLLLDPRDITIVASGGADNAEVSDDQVLFADGSAVTDFTIDAAALEAITGNVTLQAGRDIAINTSLALNNQTAGESVTFLAGRNITLTNGTDSLTTGGASLQLHAGDLSAPSPDALAAIALNGSVNTNGGDLLLRTEGTGGITFGGTINAGAGTLAFDAAGGGVLQTGGSLVADKLLFRGVGTVDVPGTTNNTRLLAANITGALNYIDLDSVTVGSVAYPILSGGTTVGITTNNNNVQIAVPGTGDIFLQEEINAGTQNVSLFALGGTVTSLGASGRILANNLDVSANGTVTLDSVTNNVAGLAIAAGGDVSYADASGFNIATLTNPGLASIGNITLRAGGAVTQSDIIVSNGLALLGTGDFTLTNTSNNIGTLAANTTGRILFADGAAGFSVGTVGATTGLTTTLDAVLIANAAVTQTQDIQAAQLELLGAGATFTLDRATNTLGTVASNAATDVSIADADGFVVGTVNGTNGINASGTVTLSSGGAVTQTQAISAPSLLLLGAGPFSLTDNSNAAATLAGNTSGAVQYTSAAGFTVGTVGATTGFTSTGALTLTARTGLLQINNAVSADGISLIADAMGIGATTASSGDIGITSFTSGLDISLAGGAVPGGSPLALSQTSLDNLSTTGSGVVTIGSATAGTIGAGSLALGSTDYDLTLRGQRVEIDALALSSGSTLTLHSEANGINQVGGAIVASNLRLLGSGSVNLSNSLNDFGTVAGTMTGGGSVFLADGTGFAIGGTGLSLAADLCINSGGPVTQTASIIAPGLCLMGTGPFTLNDAANDIQRLAGTISGDAFYRDANGFDLGTVLGQVGFTSGGNVSLQGTTAVTQSQAIVSSGLGLLGSAYFGLNTQIGNLVGTLAASTTNGVNFYNNADLSIGTVGTTIGVSATGAFNVETAGSLTVNQPMHSDTAFFLHSGIDGSGDIAFGGGVTMGAPSITLQAGDGTGGAGSSAQVVSVTTTPIGGVPVIFQGAAGGASVPTTLIIRQDASVTDAASIPQAVQFGDGSIGPSGMVYTIQSDDGGVSLGVATKVAGTFLTLTSNGASGGGVQVSTDITPAAFTLNSILPSSILGVATGGAGQINLNGGVNIGGSLVTLGGNINLNGATAFTGAARSVDAGPATITINGAIVHGVTDLTLRANEVEVFSDITGTGRLAIEPFTQSLDVTVGVAGGTNNTLGLDVSLSELTHIQDGHAGILIGSATGTGTLTLPGPTTFADPITLRSGATGGVVRINGLLQGSGDASITLDGDITVLNASVVTGGNAITIGNHVLIKGDQTIDSTNNSAISTGGAIHLLGTVDADAATPDALLTIHSGVGGIAMDDVVGGGRALGGLSATSGAGIAARSVSTGGDQTYTMGTNSSLTLNGALTASGASSGGPVSGKITVNGGVILAGDSSMTSAGLAATDDVLITGGVNCLDLNGHSLVLTAGLGDVGVQQDAGTGAGVATLSGFSASGTTVTTHEVRTNGQVTYTGGTTLLLGDVSGQDLRFNGPVTIGGDLTLTATNTATFNSTIISDNGQRTLAVDAVAALFLGAIGATPGNELGTFSVANGSASFYGGSITTVGAQTYGPQTTLGADTTFKSLGIGDITFGGLLDSAGATAANLISTTGGVTIFGGNVGQFTPFLQSVTVNGATRIGGSIKTAGNQLFGGAVDVSADSTLAANAVTFFSTVDSFNSTSPSGLNINASSGSVTLTNNVGDSRPLQFLGINSAFANLRQVTTVAGQTYTAVTRLDGNLNSNGAPGATIAINGAAILGAGVSVGNAGAAGDPDVNVTFNGTVDSANGGPARSLTVAGGAGSIEFRSGVGQTDKLDQLSVRGSTISLQLVSTTGAQIYQGTTSLNANLNGDSGGLFFVGSTILRAGTELVLTSTNGDIDFVGDVSTDGTPRSLTVNTGGGGRTRFAAGVGGNGLLQNLTTNSDGHTLFSGGAVRTIGTQTYNDVVTLSANTAFQAGAIVFERILDSESGGAAATARFNLPSTGTVNFKDRIGSISPLQSLTVLGGQSFVSNNITTLDGISLGGITRLTGDSVMNAGSGTFFFGARIFTDESLATPASLSLFTSALADVDTSRNIGNTGFNRADIIPFKFVESIGVAPSSGATTGHDYRLRSLTFSASGNPNSLPGGAPAPSATIVLARGVDTEGHLTASAFGATDAFTIATSGDFVMGFGQKLTSFGDLTINAGGTARLGDLTSLAGINVSANAIVLRLRAGGQNRDAFIQTPSDVLDAPDQGLDFVANGNITFTLTGGGVVTTEGSGARPQFARPSRFAVDPDLATFTFRDFSPAVGTLSGTFSDFFNDSRTRATQSSAGPNFLALDLKAQGPSLTSVSTTIAGAIPRDTELRQVSSTPNISRSLEEPLQRMGLLTRDLEADAALEFLVGRSLYEDSFARFDPEKPEGYINNRSNDDYYVTFNRLASGPVMHALSLYQPIAYEPRMDENGQPMYDDRGQPVYGTEPTHLVFVKSVIAKAWDQYTGELNAKGAGAQASGAGFRDYIESRPNDKAAADAKNSLNDLRGFFDAVDAIGLSEYESSIPKEKLKKSVRPDQMTADQFNECIYRELVAMK